ncbi:MAG: glycosyltransferase family 25 protein [Methylomonas sp.]|jgi:hypothetical protein
MASLLNYFQQIYIINLPHRTDRKAEMAAQLAKIGLNLDQPQIMLFPAIRPADAGAFPSIGARGCFLSHLAVLSDALQRNFDRILIFEDDLDFVENFNTRMPLYLDTLQHMDWHIFYGGYSIVDPVAAESASEPPHAGHFKVAPSNQEIVTTHFLAFQRQVIHELVDYLRQMLQRPDGDPAGGPMHVDGAYSWYRRAHPDRVTVLATPELGYQRWSRTDLHDPNWYDRVYVFRFLTDLYRRFKNSCNRK